MSQQSDNFVKWFVYYFIKYPLIIKTINKKLYVCLQNKLHLKNAMG